MLAQLDFSTVMNEQKKQILMGTSMKKISALFAENARLIFVPTNQSFFGHLEIHRALEKDSKIVDLIQEKVSEIDQVLHQFVCNNTVVEETIMTFAHTEDLNWLLPGVKPTKKSITIPIVTVVEFNEEGKIQNKRVYWDQASVLKQVGVLPTSLYCRSNSSEVTLPVAGAEIVKPLEIIDETVPSQQPQVRQASRRTESNDIFSVQQENFRPSSRVLARPGGQTHDIFFAEPVASPKPKGRQAPGGSSLNLYDDSPAPIQKKSNYRDPNWSNADTMEEKVKETPYAGKTNESHFKLGEEVDPVHFVPAKKVDPTLNQSHINFAQEEQITGTPTKNRRDPNAQSESYEQRPSSRVLNVPGGKQSFSFEDAPIPAISKARDPNAQSQEATKVRPSSRVLSVPGGASSISLA